MIISISVCQSVFSLLCYIFFAFTVLNQSSLSILIFMIAAVVLVIFIAYIRLPTADNDRVDRILGLKEGDTRLSVVAHRACGLDAPENSISALKKVVEAGIKAVEFDVSLSSDNLAVVFHDPTLTRMTDDDNRRIDSVPFEELRGINIAKNDPRGHQFPDETIPSFDDYVRYCIEHKIVMFIDLKANEKGLAPIINDAFKKYPELIDLAIVSSFDPKIIYAIRAADPRIVGCMAWRPYVFSHETYSAQQGPQGVRSPSALVQFYQKLQNIVSDWLLWNFLFHIVGISVILLHKDTICSDVLNHWKKRNVHVLAWTVNLPTEKAYFERCLQVPYLTDTLMRS